MKAKRLYRVCRVLVWGVVACCALAWMLGRLLTDRYAWTQPVWWIPSPLLLAPVWFFALALLASRALARTQLQPRARRARRRAPAILGVFVVISAVHLAFVELRVHNAIAGSGNRSADDLRVVFWNQAGDTASDLGAEVVALDPTVFVLANRHSGTKTRDIAQAFIDSGEAHAAVGWPFDCFTRLPVRRWASTSLGLSGKSRSIDGSPRDDPGWAAWFELQSAAGPVVIWAIDLPSDPRRHRMPLAQQAGRAIAEWEGSVQIVTDEGRWSEPAALPGFPAPDLIVGDFNIPRGSASLEAFVRESRAGPMRDAFAQAGFGWRRTWPTRSPIWAIDHALVGPDLRTRSMRTLRVGSGEHRALMIELGQ